MDSWDYTDLTDTFSRMDQVMEDFQRDLATQKEKVLRERIKQLGIPLDLELQKEKLFKDFIIVQEGDKSHYFYNDGSVKGQRIVTFELETITGSQSEFRIAQTLNWY